MPFARPCLASAAVALAGLLSSALAGAASAPPSSIEFPRGSASTVIKGGVARGEVARYQFVAGPDQWAAVAAKSVEENAVFQLYAPGWKLATEDGDVVVTGEALWGAGEEDDATSWSGPLLDKGTYLLVVGSSRGGADYELSLAIRQPTEEDCGDLAQQPMNQCVGMVARNLEAQRAKVYAKLAATLDPARRATLDKVEAAWKAYRDAECDFEAAVFEGGSIQPTIYGGCLNTLTTNRIKELSDLLSIEDQ
jgi:uncharacterized protein YecT (DUF1311 family)